MLINSGTFKTKVEVPKREVCRALYNFMQGQGFNLATERNTPFFVDQAGYDIEYSQFWEHSTTGLMVAICPRVQPNKNGAFQWWIEERIRNNGEDLTPLEKALEKAGLLSF